MPCVKHKKVTFDVTYWADTNDVYFNNFYIVCQRKDKTCTRTKINKFIKNKS